MKNPKKRRKMNGGKISLAVIMLFLVVAMSVAMISLYQKNKTYAAKEESLKKELEAAQEEAQDLEDYEAYTKTNEYVENTAKSKLGLVYDNEIIFRENK